jgi:hypothetical protein
MLDGTQNKEHGANSMQNVRMLSFNGVAGEDGDWETSASIALLTSQTRGVVQVEHRLGRFCFVNCGTVRNLVTFRSKRAHGSAL